MTNEVMLKLNEMSIEELRNLNKTIVAMIRTKQSFDGIVKKAELKVGSTVYINNPKFKGEKFIVEKINIKKAVFSSDSFNHSVEMTVKDFISLEKAVVDSFGIKKKIKKSPAPSKKKSTSKTKSS